MKYVKLLSAMFTVWFFFLSFAAAKGPLPIWPTEEELKRMDEIGTYTVPTPPPTEKVKAPGEFDNAQGVLLRWDRGWWQGLYIDMTGAIVEHSKAYIIVANNWEQNQVENQLIAHNIPLDSVEFVIKPTNSVWIRDYGPWWIYHEDGTRGIVDWVYNRPRPQDDSIPIRLGEDWSIPVYTSSLVHTGGNFMVDGHGVGFASNLIYQENPGLTPAKIDSIMGVYMGLDTFYVFTRIYGEYTGHIDMWGKLIDDHTFMVAYYPPGDQNHNILNNHAAAIANLTNGNSILFDTVRIPSPPPYSGVYRSYTNSLIVNKLVLLPIYNHAYDSIAVRIYQERLPGYDIRTFDCSDIIQSGGAVHCITKLVMSPYAIFITHTPLLNTEDTVNPYRVEATITATMGLNGDSTFVYWDTDTSPPFNMVKLIPDTDSVNLFFGYIPAQHYGTTVYYYIYAMDTTGYYKTSPSNALYELYSFKVGEQPGIVESDKAVCRFLVRPFINPFKDKLMLSIYSDEPKTIQFCVFNITGQQIFSNSILLKKGLNIVTWNPNDGNSYSIPAGVYFYQIIAGEETNLGKVLHLK